MELMNQIKELILLKICVSKEYYMELNYENSGFIFKEIYLIKINLHLKKMIMIIKI